MSGKNFKAERAARILVDAEILGDKRAAAEWKCDRRTIRNYRQKAREDEAFASLFRTTLAKFDNEWRAESVRTLRLLLVQMREKAPNADLKDLALAVEKVGGLHVAREALGVGAEADREDPTPPAPPAPAGNAGAEAQLH